MEEITTTAQNPIVEQNQTVEQNEIQNQEAKKLKIRIISFELLDIPPPSRNQRYTDRDVCYLRLVGRSMDDKVVSVWATGHTPYFFLQCPEHWNEYHCSMLRDEIMKNVQNAGLNLVNCEFQMSYRTYGFSDDKLFPFIKLTFRGIKSMLRCRRFFEQPLRFDWDTPPGNETSNFATVLEVCEQTKKIPDCLKVIQDTLIQPSGWVSIDLDNCLNVGGEASTDLNLHTELRNIEPVESDDIPNFVEMSFDGEMISPSFEFPRPKKTYDIIAMLAVNFRRRSEKEPYYRAVLCLGPMNDIKGVDVRRHKTERDLLWDFRALFKKHNPDIWTGYNINKFDFPYILRRAQILEMPPEFFNWGRIVNEKTDLVISFKSKDKYGRNVSHDHKKVVFNTVKIPGCRIEDAYHGVKNNPKRLTSYKLENVANFFLGEGKHPVEPEDIFRAYQDITDHMQCTDQLPILNHFLTEVRVMIVFYSVTRSQNLNHPENTKYFSAPGLNNNVGSNVAVFSESYIFHAVSSRWPAQYKEQVVKVLTDVFRCLHVKGSTLNSSKGGNVYSFEECDAIVKDYFNFRTKGSTLTFGPLLLNLSETWFQQGIRLEQIPSEDDDAHELLQKLLKTPTKVSKKTKREREEEKQMTSDVNHDESFDARLKSWESRIEAEVDVYNMVLSKNTTKKFAQKWWKVNDQLSSFFKDTKDTNDVNAQDLGERGKLCERGKRAFESNLESHLAWLQHEKDRIGAYCDQDAILPAKLRQKQQHGLALLEMSRITYVPCDMLQEKGQTIKVINLFMMWCRKNNRVITYIKIPEVFFKGGEVLKPKKKFWKDRVFTLDFNSLYPSLIQENKLCFLSLILPGMEQLFLNRPDLEINSIDIGEPSNHVYHWVQNRRVALPEILEFLVSERGRVKKLLEVETDPIKQVVYDQRQLQIKLVGNSAYGFTGYTKSPWPCIAIAVCTTVKGRNAIMLAKEKAEQRFNANVIYGDSVTADTPILCRLGSQYIGYCNVSELPRETQWLSHRNDGEGQIEGKEYAVPMSGMEVWTERGFTKIEKVIRHKTQKRIYAVRTESSYVTVTEDHSLLDQQAQKVSPKDVSIGFPLLHTPTLPFIETPAEAVQKAAFSMGHFFGSGVCFFDLTNEEDFNGNEKARVKLQWSIAGYDKQVMKQCCSELQSVFHNVEFFIKDDNLLTDKFEEESCGPYELTIRPIYPQHRDYLYQFVKEWYDSFYSLAGHKMVPLDVVNAPKADVVNFLRGYHQARVDCFGKADLEGQITSASLLYLYEKVGLKPKLTFVPHEWKVAKKFALTKDKNPFKNWALDNNGACRVDISHCVDDFLTRVDDFSSDNGDYHLSNNEGNDVGQRKDDQEKGGNIRIGEHIVELCDVTNTYKGQYVYDLQTENHHFSAGIGRMIVHNTDSIMAIVPIPDDLTSDLEKMEYVFRIAKEAADYISSFFKKPMKLAFEKVYYPYLLQAKKRYTGMKYLKPEAPEGVDTKGFEAIRRDNCAILRNTVLAIFKVLLETMDISRALRIALNSFKLIAEQRVPLEDLIISKQLGDDYKSENLIQVQVAKYLEENYPLLAPQVGDRVPYVVVKTKNETRNTKAYTKGFDPTLAQREGLEIDWYYYAFKQLRGPLSRIFGILTNKQLNKNMDGPQPTDYLFSPYLEQIKENDKLQQHRVNGQAVVDKFFVQKKQKQWDEPNEHAHIDLPETQDMKQDKLNALNALKQKDGDIRNMFKKK
jgi:DNA polymerase elongation subunit (family B)